MALSGVKRHEALSTMGCVEYKVERWVGAKGGLPATFFLVLGRTG